MHNVKNHKYGINNGLKDMLLQTFTVFHAANSLSPWLIQQTLKTSKLHTIPSARVKLFATFSTLQLTAKLSVVVLLSTLQVESLKYMFLKEILLQ